MPYFRLCYLCRSHIDSKAGNYRETKWKAFNQELFLQQTDGSAQWHLPPPDQMIMSVGGSRVVHSACWVVVTKVFDPFDLDATWLARFTETLADLHPFLTPIAFEAAPDRLESSLDKVEEEASRDEPRKGLGVFEKFHVPRDVIQLIYACLDRYDDVCNLRQVALEEPSTGVWLSLGLKFRRCDPRFAEGTPREIASRIQSALKNLRDRPSLFPHASNYCTVWNNAIILRSKMEDPLAGQRTSEELSNRYFIYANPRLNILQMNALKIDAKLAPASTLQLRFSHVGARRYICGLGINGNFSGYRGDSSLSIGLASLSGIRTVADEEGFGAIQVKDGLSWRDVWYGTVPEDQKIEGIDLLLDRRLKLESHLAFSELEWPPDTPGDLVLAFDTFRVLGLSYKVYDRNLPERPWTWWGGFPIQSYRPVLALDRSVEDPLNPFWFVERNISEAKSIHTFVYCRSRQISGIRIDYESKSSALLGFEEGNQLSVILDSEAGETWTGIAVGEATMNDGIALKVYTSFGRVVRFGDENVSQWSSFSPLSGLFCTSRTRHDNSLSTLGVFQGRKQELIQRTEPLTPKESLSWSISSVQLDKRFSPSLAYLSQSSLECVTKISVFEEPSDSEYTVGIGSITGISLSYQHKGPVVLGEARSHLKSFSLQERIKRITVYYDVLLYTCYKIRGLRFDLSSECVEVGRCEAELVDHLEITEDQNVLYWTFTRSFSYLSLSAEDTSPMKLQP